MLIEMLLDINDDDLIISLTTQIRNAKLQMLVNLS